MRISQCMIVKNEEKNIERALSWGKSLMWEQIVVDTGSTDRTVELAQKLGAQVYHFPWIDDFAAAKNYAIEQAQGEWIAFLDADDVWFPNKLERELAFMRSKGAGFVFTAYEFGDGQAEPTGKVVHVPAELTYRKALSRTVIFTTTVLFDREIIPAELMRMPEVESEDTATWWQILRAGYTAYGLDEVLAIYRRPAQSLSSNKLTAVRRIWNLYRRQEKLSVLSGARYFIMWAYRATMRRL